MDGITLKVKKPFFGKPIHNKKFCHEHSPIWRDLIEYLLIDTIK